MNPCPDDVEHARPLRRGITAHQVLSTDAFERYQGRRPPSVYTQCSTEVLRARRVYPEAFAKSETHLSRAGSSGE